MSLKRFILIICLILGIAPGFSLAGDIDSYIESHYLTLDKVYGKKPVNKFSNCSPESISHKKNINSKLLNEFVKKNKLSITEVVNTKCGDFIFFQNYSINLVNPEKNTHEFYEGIAYKKNNNIYFPEVNISEVDIDTGGYDKEVWDVFSYQNKNYVLILNRVYEVHLFEYYTGKGKLLVKEGEIEFGGL